METTQKKPRSKPPECLVAGIDVSLYSNQSRSQKAMEIPHDPEFLDPNLVTDHCVFVTWVG